MGDKKILGEGLRYKQSTKTPKPLQRTWCGCGCKKDYCEDPDYLIPKGKAWKKTKNFREKHKIIFDASYYY
jgi:hypothetical protein